MESVSTTMGQQLVQIEGKSLTHLQGNNVALLNQVYNGWGQPMGKVPVP